MFRMFSIELDSGILRIAFASASVAYSMMSLLLAAGFKASLASGCVLGVVSEGLVVVVSAGARG